MECREFRRHLSDYLSGDIGEPFFGQMVEHEVECARCRETVLESDVFPTEGLPLAAVTGKVVTRPSFLDSDERRRVQEEIRVRTEGRDCHWIELRMAEALEDALAPGDHEIVRLHITDCSSCRRMRDMLQALPDFYEQMPSLSAGRDFTREVMALTSGPVPGVVQILRAIWRRPEAVWEAAFACAFIAALLIGSRVPEPASMSAWVKDAAVAQMPLVHEMWETEEGEPRFGFISESASQVHSTWKGVEQKAGNVSDWMQRSGKDIRTGNYTGLLNEIRVVLEPLGLYPEEETQTQDAEGDGPAADTRDADATTTDANEAGEQGDER